MKRLLVGLFLLCFACTKPVDLIVEIEEEQQEESVKPPLPGDDKCKCDDDSTDVGK